MKLKLLIVALLLILMNTNSYGQNMPNIRFIHRGEELKPTGTLSISTDRAIIPTDRSFDKLYGKAIKTTIKSFDLIKAFIMHSKSLTHDPDELRNDSEFYEIVIVTDSNTQKLYLGEQNITSFFKSLVKSLKKHNADFELIDALKNH